jgi:hypothetical protein
MAMKPIIAPKIAPSTSTPNGKWTKSPLNLRHNYNPGRSTTPCNGLHATSNTPHPTSALSNPSIPKTQTQPLAYYQSYHYATTNHPQHPPTPQITYHPTLPQITYPTPSNTNANQVKTKPKPPLPPPSQQAQEPPQQPEKFPTHGTILTITRGSNTHFKTKR